ncbi:cytochrome p450 2u1 [Plakobranchus ocellatus]|uniref:Cytochrome p450 2u1 n=1 Tax=Plakobranchus ocellatus TaxID=259542 RepID=A0AAV4BAN5_9GAST|nr:cytochrome p450 2u1 [Plakobranchus ocellatus]
MLGSSPTSELWSAPPLSYVVVILCVFLVIKVLLQPYIQTNIPPFPARPYPILGHLPYIVKDQRIKLNEFRKTTGDIYSLYFGSQLFVVVSGLRLVKEALVKHGATLSDRAPMPHLEGGDMGIVFANGPLWKEQREVSLAILKSFGMGKSSLALKMREELDAYLDTLAALKGKPEDVHTLTSTSVANVICSIIVGKRFEYTDPLFVDFVKDFFRQVAETENISPVVIWPWLRFIPGNFMRAKTLDRCIKMILSKFCDRFIELTEKQRGTEDAPETFITSYLEEMEKLSAKGKDTTLSKGHLRRILQQLFLAGTETTTITLLWFMVFMLRHPDIQQKVYDEITSVTNSDRYPDMQDRTRLPYTTAVIMETQRRSSVSPTSVPHYCRADTSIEGYTIPAGAIVLTSLDSVLLDGDIWEEPLSFKPERFLDQAGNVVKPEAFVPFSMGKRICMGEALANMELFLYSTSLVQRFKLQPCEPGQVPSLDYREGLTCPPKPFKIRFVERESTV